MHAALAVLALSSRDWYSPSSLAASSPGITSHVFPPPISMQLNHDSGWQNFVA